MKYYYDIIQNTPEWEEIKREKISASVCSNLLLAKTNKGYKELVKRIAYERHTGKKAYQKFQGNYYTNRGHEFEPEARHSYELETFQKVDLIGFIGNDTCGCSPDGLINDDGLIQIKCLEWSAHLDLLETGKIDTSHLNQMQFELFISKREYNVFYAYHPGLTSFQKIIKKDPMKQSEIKTRLAEIEIDIKQKIENIK